ncbi:MAG TPA: phenylalanine 4-monooxygenase [Gemmatimonadaceae bacterium]|nr:phenylalanine 4-monooxygenase [Gemmatimonadaceae bacterium]
MLDMHRDIRNVEPRFIEQRWAEYTGEEHDVWGLLYARRMRTLKDTGSSVYLKGLDRIGICPDCVPDLEVVNAKLAEVTGWRAMPVEGFLPAPEFFRCLSRRQFPTTVTVRPRAQLDYLPEPDIFHDVFGHVPLHASPAFADYLQRFGEIACRAEREEQIRGMARLFWFTVEFGLVKEDGATKVYGSGLISSHADAANALGGTCERRAFSVEAVLAQPFETDRMQDVLFEIDTFGLLFHAVEEAAERLGIPRAV